MKKTAITFIGGGNMATSLIGGLLETGASPEKITVSDPNTTPLAATRFQIQCNTDNIQAIEKAGVVVLAVKPEILPEVAKNLSTAIPVQLPLFISIAAGIRIDDINRWLGAHYNLPIIRVMPNTPALVGSGASALYAGKHVTQSHRELAENILRAVGLTLWVDDESSMDMVTAVSGSGPAYFFYIMEVLEKSAINLGLSQENARLLTLQTAFGAAKMALESEEDASTLRARVTSKGGTTERGLNELQNGGLQNLFDQAVHAAHQRATEIAKQFGEQ